MERNVGELLSCMDVKEGYTCGYNEWKGWKLMSDSVVDRCLKT